METLFSKAPDSLCILRLSAIGDVCNVIAVVQGIQRYWPTTKITWIVGKVEAEIIQMLPNINVVVFDKKTGLKGMFEIKRQLKTQHFDALLHMQYSFRSNLLTLFINATYKVGFAQERAKEGQWLFTSRQIEDTSSVHVLDSFIEFAKYLGVPQFIPTWNVPISESDRTFVSQYISGSKKTLMIAPAASKDKKNWTVDGYAQIAKKMDELGYQIILCGGPALTDKVLGDGIIKQAPFAINLIAKTSLAQLIGLVAEVDLVLAPDTGIVHIATMQQTPVLGLYAYSNPERTGPYYYRNYAISVYDNFIKQQYKKSVTALPWGTQAKGADLMLAIGVEDVYQGLLRLIKDEQAHMNKE